MELNDFDDRQYKALCCFHNEKTPSLIYNPKNYTFHCFGCEKTIDIIDAFMLKGATYIEAVQQLFEKAGIPYSFGEHKVKTKKSYTYPKPENNDKREEVEKYFEQRKISPKTLDYADVQQDGQGNAVFNYYDTNDVLTMVKYKPSHKIRDKRTPKTWAQKGADTTPLLFNMNRVNASQPLLITEGEPDALTAIESGYLNSVSVPFGSGNFTWIEENWKWLEQFDSIIVCADNDEPGQKMIKEAVYRLGSWRTKIVNIPEYVLDDDGNIKIFIDSNGNKTARKINDLNEYLYYHGKEKTLELILNASDTPVPSVEDLFTVDGVDLNKLDGVNIGIGDIDRAVKKVFYGMLTILSGAPSSGKTSFLYQIICNTIDSGKKVFLFSKELPNSMSKNWIDHILAGRRNVIEINDPIEGTYCNVSSEAKRAINKYYANQCYVYKDEASATIEDLLKSMTDTVRQYGVKLLIIDNLMTIDIAANDSNELQEQTKCINSLINFAKTYNVAVILVAHPRKLQQGIEDVGMYDISGTSNIINLAHRSFGLRRVTKREKEGEQDRNGNWRIKPCKYDVIFSVIKDRVGSSNGFKCGMYYDTPSRRFFSNPDEYNKQYSWDKKDYGEPLEYPINDDEEEIFGKQLYSSPPPQ